MISLLLACRESGPPPAPVSQEWRCVSATMYLGDVDGDVFLGESDVELGEAVDVIRAYHPEWPVTMEVCYLW